MILPYSQVNRFYDIFIPLLRFTNKKTNTLPKKVMESLSTKHDPSAANALRIALWENVWILDEFIKENPKQLNKADLDIVASWKHFRFGDFTLTKLIRGRGIFFSHETPPKVYSVCPLFEPFDQLLPEIPVMVKTTLVPFENVIIFDGLMGSYPVIFGDGLRSMMKDWYADALERGAILTILPELQKTKQELMTQREKTNKSVLKHFKAYSINEGRSERIVNRDNNTAAVLAAFIKEQADEPLSLRDVSLKHVAAFLASNYHKDLKTVKIGLRRFFDFLANTERMDWEFAEQFLMLIESF